MQLSLVFILMFPLSENQVVTRGIKAVGLVYHLTGRVPALIKQSHLEENEGNDRLSDYWQRVSNI
jgi:hypothetical protein